MVKKPSPVHCSAGLPDDEAAAAAAGLDFISRGVDVGALDGRGTAATAGAGVGVGLAGDAIRGATAGFSIAIGVIGSGAAGADVAVATGATGAIGALGPGPGEITGSAGPAIMGVVAVL